MNDALRPHVDAIRQAIDDSVRAFKGELDDLSRDPDTRQLLALQLAYRGVRREGLAAVPSLPAQVADAAESPDPAERARAALYEMSITLANPTAAIAELQRLCGEVGHTPADLTTAVGVRVNFCLICGAGLE